MHIKGLSPLHRQGTLMWWQLNPNMTMFMMNMGLKSMTCTLFHTRMMMGMTSTSMIQDITGLTTQLSSLILTLHLEDCSSDWRMSTPCLMDYTATMLAVWTQMCIHKHPPPNLVTSKQTHFHSFIEQLSPSMLGYSIGKGLGWDEMRMMTWGRLRTSWVCMWWSHWRVSFSKDTMSCSIG